MVDGPCRLLSEFYLRPSTNSTNHILNYDAFDFEIILPQNFEGQFSIIKFAPGEGNMPEYYLYYKQVRVVLVYLTFVMIQQNKLSLRFYNKIYVLNRCRI